MEQPGGYSKSFHRSYHDPCKVRAALFDDGTQRVALVGLDTLIVPRTIVLEARARIEKLTYLIQKEPAVEVEVQALQVGPAVFVSNPAEFFVELGLAIKEGSPFPFTFPVELANGCVGYVPTEEAFGPNGGGYETRLTAYSNLVITAGSTLRDVGIELTRSLLSGPVPEPPRAPPFAKPWTYGNVPPEIE